MRLIDADALKNIFKDEDGGVLEKAIIGIIDAQPTIDITKGVKEDAKMS